MKTNASNDPFYFTAAYKNLSLFGSREELVRWIRTESRAEQKKARNQNMPLPRIPEKDFQRICTFGVNAFNLHDRPPEAEFVASLLERGFAVFAYAADFYFLAPQTPDGGIDRRGCLREIQNRFLDRQGPFLLCVSLESFCPHAGPDYPYPRHPISKHAAYEAFRKSFCEHNPEYLAVRDYCQKCGFDSRRFKLVIGQHQQWHHYAAEWGADVLFTEGNCDLPNDQARTAIIRGAARQYGREWFEYFSSWGGVNREITWFDECGELKSGITPSLSLRQWIAAFYSGCRYCNGIESPASQLYYRNASGKRRVSEFGRNAKKFTRFVFKRHPDRGTPCVPAALMLEHGHGWTPRDHRVFGGSVPYTRAEEMIDNFFNAAFPGQEADLPNQRLPWRHDGRFPWSTHQELFAMERAGKFDHRIYEKGIRTDSTWGDSFDVVLENCPLEVLVRYKAVILLGGIRLNPELTQTLRAYAEQGGIVLINAVQAGPEHSEFLGVDFLGRREVLWETACTRCGSVFRDWETEIELVRPLQSSVLLHAVGGYRGGSRALQRIPGYDGCDPVATSRQLGRGRVVFTTLPYMQTAPGRGLHPACADLIDHLMQDLLPVEIRGAKIEFMINITADSLIVTLMHNGPDYWKNARGRPWKGDLIIKDAVTRVPGAGEISAAEWWNDRALPFRADGKSIVIPLTVKPFGFQIVAITRKSRL